jgi:hypothetical protein
MARPRRPLTHFRSEMSKSKSAAHDQASVPGSPFEFMQGLWRGLPLPGALMPNFAGDDISKQIADLKAVESWLTLNMNMLRGTIQALEVQAATLNALQAMQQSMQAAAKPGEEGGTWFTSPSAEPQFQSPFASPFQSEASSGSAPDQKPQARDRSFGANGSDGADRTDKNDGGGAVKTASAAPANPFGNPAAWWDMLQNQFRQAVEASLQQADGQHGEQTRSPDATVGAAESVRQAGAKAGKRAGSADKPARKSKAAAKGKSKVKPKPGRL